MLFILFGFIELFESAFMSLNGFGNFSTSVSSNIVSPSEAEGEIRTGDKIWELLSKDGN